MITDEQGIKWVLQKLYDSGYRTIETTTMCRIVGRLENGVDIPLLNDCRRLNDAVRGEVIKNDGIITIAAYLGIVDWSKVPVDTPVLVRNDEFEQLERRYFAKYKDGKTYTWNHGRTSWSNYKYCVEEWKEAHLATVDEREADGASSMIKR